MRKMYQVLVIPYRYVDERIEYCILRRTDDGSYWQWVSGGGEENEKPIDSALREFYEEAGIACKEDRVFKLETIASVPAKYFSYYSKCSPGHVVIEHSFAIEVNSSIKLSEEHDCFEWVDYDTAMKKLHWDSNKTALWELSEKLKRSKND